MAIAFESRVRRRRAIAIVALCFSVLAFALTTVGFFGAPAEAQNVRPPANAVENGIATEGGGVVGREVPNEELTDGAVPGGSLGINSDADLWRYVRGVEVPDFDATVSIPNEQAAILVQSQGDEWRSIRNGALSTYGLYGLAGMLGALVVFFVLRGRIKVDHGMSGQTIERFNGLERFGHWLLAVSFIILALSGLNILYGRYFLPDLIGAEAFASLSQAGKWAHNNVAWAFMLGLVMVFFMWVLHNIPSKIDLQWIAKGGGLFSKNVHPDSRKFNAGQKLIFWSTILLGASLSLSGIALLFPFETAMMGKTFGVLNVFGFGLQTNLTPLQEMQYQTIWHGIVGLAMITVIIAHIYIGSLGMEGAFDAMGSGQVDLNWAKEHHNLWVDEVQAAEKSSAKPSGSGAAATPAE
ncbi:MAG: formate dehydrogenase subunit gamma [Pseudomonadota bacterium]